MRRQGVQSVNKLPLNIVNMTLLTVGRPHTYHVSQAEPSSSGAGSRVKVQHDYVALKYQLKWRLLAA